MKNYLLMVVLLFSFQGKAESRQCQSHFPFIIGGDQLTDSELPQMAKLSASGWMCSATLVGPRVIVTAAHCVEGYDYRDYNQQFGPIGGKMYTATMTRHPGYEVSSSKEILNIPEDLAVKNDLAIGVLDTPVDNVEPLSLTTDAPKLNDMVLYAGTGLPRYVRMTGMSQVVTVGSRGITLHGTGDKTQIGDSGDSGGPNFITYSDGSIKVYAVTSTSTRERDYTKELNWPFALPYSQGVSLLFPRLQAGEMDFIRKTIEENKLEVCGVNLKCASVKNPRAVR